MKRYIVLLVLLAMTSACKTASMADIKRIPIPEGLTSREAIAGVVLSTDPAKMPKQWTNAEKIFARYVDAYSGSNKIGDRDVVYSERNWRVEEVRDGYAVLGLAIKNHYARVKYTVRGADLVPEVVCSDNLKQSETRIHQNAVMWINRNIPIIREGMWQVKTIKEAATDSDAVRQTLKVEILEATK